jgi:hypothetical protein
MYFIIYETTNLINGKKYRGAHISKSLNDEYIGSGKLLKKAITKYGIENFERKNLLICDSLEHMFEQELKYVDEKWVNDENTYNLKIGGEGGWDYINKTGKRWNEEKKRLQSIEMKKKRKVGEWGPKNPTYGFKNRKHSEETKQKISMNNGSLLNREEIEKRILEWNSLENVRGKVTKISKIWGVSHTQVRRFVNKFILSVA